MKTGVCENRCDELMNDVACPLTAAHSAVGGEGVESCARISNQFGKPRSALSRTFALVLLFFTLIAAPSKIRADNVSSSFESANKLYEEGKYADAAAGYDKLIATGKVSDAVYFNRGNALFKMGQTGRAIASYRQAERLAPRDTDLLANLQFARTHARGGSNYQASRVASFLEKLSLNEWTFLATIAFWVFFILLALGQWRPAIQSKTQSYRYAVIAALVIFGGCLAYRIDTDCLTTSAVVVVGEADVRNGPLDESQSIFKVRDGIELEVTDKKDGWLEVTDSNQRSGWLRQENVLILESQSRATVRSTF